MKYCTCGKIYLILPVTVNNRVSITGKQCKIGTLSLIETKCYKNIEREMDVRKY